VVPITGLTQAYVGVTSGAETSHPSVVHECTSQVHEFTSTWILVWSIFSFMWSAL